MKRVILSVSGTVVGIVALLSYKTHSPLATPSGGLPAAALPNTSATAGASSPTASNAGAPPDPTSKSIPSSGPAPTSTTSTVANFTGDAAQTQYGIVQVKITVSGKKITNVAFVQLTAFDSRSQEINYQAAPILLHETLQAQSANINSVSGASYTSAGYMQSLQSAIDKAGI
jgi:uncharacterized protein with FMN-binding domain